MVNSDTSVFTFIEIFYTIWRKIKHSGCVINKYVHALAVVVVIVKYMCKMMNLVLVTS